MKKSKTEWILYSMSLWVSFQSETMRSLIVNDYFQKNTYKLLTEKGMIEILSG